MLICHCSNGCQPFFFSKETTLVQWKRAARLMSKKSKRKISMRALRFEWIPRTVKLIGTKCCETMSEATQGGFLSWRAREREREREADGSSTSVSRHRKVSLTMERMIIHRRLLSHRRRRRRRKKNEICLLSSVSIPVCVCAANQKSKEKELCAIEEKLNGSAIDKILFAPVPSEIGFPLLRSLCQQSIWVGKSRPIRRRISASHTDLVVHLRMLLVPDAQSKFTSIWSGSHSETGLFHPSSSSACWTASQGTIFRASSSVERLSWPRIVSGKLSKVTAVERWITLVQ